MSAAPFIVEGAASNSGIQSLTPVQSYMLRLLLFGAGKTILHRESLHGSAGDRAETAEA